MVEMENVERGESERSTTEVGRPGSSVQSTGDARLRRGAGRVGRYGNRAFSKSGGRAIAERPKNPKF